MEHAPDSTSISPSPNNAAAALPGTSAGASHAPAYRSAFAWLRFLLPAGLGLLVDLYTKALTFPEGVGRDAETGRLLFHQGAYWRDPTALPHIDNSFPLLPGFLSVETTANEGAVFGIGQGKVAFFLAFSVLALFLIGWVFATSGRRQRWLHIALGLITAGALGNLYDRALFGAVRDLLKFNVNWYPYIFNIADVLLCIGVPLLMICWVFTKPTADGNTAVKQ